MDTNRIEDICAICKEKVYDAKVDKILKPVIGKALQILAKYSILHKNEALHNYLRQKGLSIQIDGFCSKWFNNKKHLCHSETHTVKKQKVETQASTAVFDCKKQFILRLKK